MRPAPVFDTDLDRPAPPLARSSLAILSYRRSSPNFCSAARNAASDWRTLVGLFAAMVLSRCGCADAACTTGYWQLQTLKTSQQTTASGTTASPTRQTYTCATGRCHATITVQSGAVQQFQGIGFNALLLVDSGFDRAAWPASSHYVDLVFVCGGILYLIDMVLISIRASAHP